MKKDQIYEIIEISSNHIIEDLRLSESYSEPNLNQIRESLKQQLAFELLNAFLVSTGRAKDVLETKVENENQLAQVFDRISSELLSHPEVIKSAIIKFRNKINSNFEQEIDKINQNQN